LTPPLELDDDDDVGGGEDDDDDGVASLWSLIVVVVARGVVVAGIKGATGTRVACQKILPKAGPVMIHDAI
jgi:hypothetical protein